MRALGLPNYSQVDLASSCSGINSRGRSLGIRRDPRFATLLTQQWECPDREPKIARGPILSKEIGSSNLTRSAIQSAMFSQFDLRAEKSANSPISAVFFGPTLPTKRSKPTDHIDRC
jgi:hypothetical protein